MSVGCDRSALDDDTYWGDTAVRDDDAAARNNAAARDDDIASRDNGATWDNWGGTGVDDD